MQKKVSLKKYFSLLPISLTCLFSITPILDINLNTGTKSYVFAERQDEVHSILTNDSNFNAFSNSETYLEEDDSSKTNIGAITFNIDGNMEKVEGYRKKKEQEQSKLENNNSSSEKDKIESGIVGRIKFSPDEKAMEEQFSINRNKGNIISGTSEAVKESLEKIAKMQAENKFDQAIQELNILANTYPEYPLFPKWIAIYQNRLGQFKDSNDTIQSIKYSYPFNKEELDRDSMLLYYEIDNLRNLKEYDEFQEKLSIFSNFINEAKTQREELLSNIENKDIIDNDILNNIKDLNSYITINSILQDYQILQLEYTKNKEIDENKLNSLWKNIPNAKKMNLNKFYGFNIDDIGYFFGKKYHRKDVLKRYVEQEEWSNQKNTIRKVQDAKSILFESY